jgi:hypothetical protein
MKEFPTCEPSSIASSSSIRSVPNRGERADADDEVVMPNKEELVFDVEEEPNMELPGEKTGLPVKAKGVDAGELNFIGMVCVVVPRPIPLVETWALSAIKGLEP